MNIFDDFTRAFVRLVAQFMLALGACVLLGHLAVTGLGVLFVSVSLGVTIGRWLKQQPTPASDPRAVGLKRAMTGFAVLGIPAVLSAFARGQGLHPDQALTHGLLLVTFGCAIYLIVDNRPRGRRRARLRVLANRARAAFGTPVMGGAAS